MFSACVQWCWIYIYWRMHVCIFCLLFNIYIYIYIYIYIVIVIVIYIYKSLIETYILTYVWNNTHTHTHTHTHIYIYIYIYDWYLSNFSLVWHKVIGAYQTVKHRSSLQTRQSWLPRKPKFRMLQLFRTELHYLPRIKYIAHVQIYRHPCARTRTTYTYTHTYSHTQIRAPTHRTVYFTDIQIFTKRS